MRWDDLFADLEAQAEAAAAAELAGEVADRTRREHGLLRLVDRLRAASGADAAAGQVEGGATVTVTVLGAGTVHGRLLDVGVDWLLLHETGHRELLLNVAAVLGVIGVGARSEAPASEDQVTRKLDLRWALRGLARSRAGVQVVLVDGTTLSGTLDRVGADHVDLAEHPPGEVRRAPAVRQVRLIPLTALTAVRGVG
jgi:hypothetical protein